MKAAFSPQAAKQRLFCRLEVVYGADAFDDFGGGADLGDDFVQGLVGHDSSMVSSTTQVV